MKCHYVTEPRDGKRYLIPGCVPGWYNSAACICRPAKPPKEPDPKDRLIRELERENARLNRIIYQLINRRQLLSGLPPTL